MTELTMGGNAPVGDGLVEVAIAWRNGAAPVSIDVSAFVLGADRKVRGDADMIFFNQPQSGDGSIRISGSSADATTFSIDLKHVPSVVEIIAFTATVDGAPVPLSNLSALTASVRGGPDAISFDAPRGSEVALIVGELYRRNGQWKFRAVGQGFNGGLQPLAESFGIKVDAPPASPAPTPPISSARPPSTPAPSKVSLTKVTLTKAQPSISLEKKSSGGYGEIKINLNWNRGGQPQQGSSILGGMFGGGKPKGIDLDLACLFELNDGRLGVVQALGNNFGRFEHEPFIHLLADDRTGASVDGEWMRINGQRWSDIRRVLIYTFIYDGAPNWAATDGVITVLAPDQAPIEVRLDEGRSNAGTCAIALIENDGGRMVVRREVQYFRDASEMDRAYHWGLRWTRGSKD